MRALIVGTLILLVGCSTPAPSESASQSSPPTTGDSLAEAAAAASVDVDQLIDISGTLVAPRLSGQVLELVRITRVEEEAWQATVAELPALASFDDAAPDRTDNFVTCSAEPGEPAQSLIVGETTYSEMRLEEVPSLGGHVADGTYLIAITAEAPAGKWELLGDGQRISSGSATVVPGVSQGDGCVTH